jgi:hypothetical protein
VESKGSVGVGQPAVSESERRVEIDRRREVSQRFLEPFRSELVPVMATLQVLAVGLGIVGSRIAPHRAGEVESLTQELFDVLRHAPFERQQIVRRTGVAAPPDRRFGFRFDDLRHDHQGDTARLDRAS